ncbi:sigma-54-dependent Fis family transcriptional regulator [Gordonia rhizosphera]|uniref:Putative transcriptional regulator n=1 Tax=Gordonia rhizosphera NBRC 16068 TaxID=1108045 RepID=K6X4Z3_9ACTN|nr:helix-turn-helix domain-containing protein [Gordonia rhizosphera]GAB93834.1 putative transcriptional regulator [Gordonia rhizosphera NBRC 16068]
MSDLRELQLRIAAARADFLEYGPLGAAGVGDVVAASWARSQSAGVDADRYRVIYHEDIDFDSRLARCARPVITRLTDDMSDVPVTIALTDSQARIIDRRDCSSAVGRVLDRVDFQRGFSFEESGCGTNGVGTAFEIGGPVSVVGCEHFNQSLIQFACTGAPIFDPLTGRAVGVLDVSMLAESWTTLVEALVRSAAAEISRNLLLDRSQATRALFETYLRADARPRQSVMAIGDTLMVNEHARELLSPDEQNTVAQYAEFLMSKQDRGVHTVTLETGRTIRMRTNCITCNGDAVGMVLLLDEVRGACGLGAPSAVNRPGRIALPVASSREMRSPAWAKALAETTEALAERTAVLVLGEPGTGRLSLISDAFGELHGSSPVVIVDAVRVERGEQVAMPATDIDGPALLVVRHLDRIGPSGHAEIASMIARATETGHHIAATAEPIDGEVVGSFADLLHHFGCSVTIPPLRLRGPDLPHITDRIMKILSPHRHARISPQASRIIAAFSWPGNITQLREALETALRRRPVGEIQAADLPGFCRSSTTRALTPLEATERDAIVNALEEADGNRMRAAHAVGMSRSSLYRKMHTYGISGI